MRQIQIYTDTLVNKRRCQLVLVERKKTTYRIDSRQERDRQVMGIGIIIARLGSLLLAHIKLE